MHELTGLLESFDKKQPVLPLPVQKDNRGVYTTLSKFAHRLENTTIQQEAITEIFNMLKLKFDERTEAVIKEGRYTMRGVAKP